MAGHLFVTRGDLTKLACDAALVPSGYHDGRRGHVQESWAGLTGSSSTGFLGTPPSDPSVLVWKHDSGAWPQPAVWIGHTGDDSHSPEDDARVLAEFVKAAAADVRQTVSGAEARRPLNDDRPLLAVPLVGTGLGGRADIKGHVVKAIVEELERAVIEHDADVVLVTWTDADYSAAQQSRAHLSGSVGSGLSLRSDPVFHLLLEQASNGRLVLFVGAGVSMGAGLPSWSDLLGRLARLADLPELAEELARSSTTVDNRDIGTLLERRLEKKGMDLSAQVRGIVDDAALRNRSGAPRVSLQHQILASLPASHAITTNYDVLFETAWRDAGRDPVVLPTARREVVREWVLKLHGSADDDGPLVLSRGDYLRFEGQSAALAGLVQAMLLTRHLLFVGYSLSDDNFHRMVHQVRVAARVGREGARVGTVLTPGPRTVLDEIWQPEIEFVSASADGRFDPRRLAIVLDLLAAETSPPGAHLLDDAYCAVFTGEELALTTAIRQLRAASTAPGVRPRLKAEVEASLRPFGEDVRLPGGCTD